MKDRRLTALRRFSVAITVLNVLGHSMLGFEQSWACPILALLVAYSTELVIEWMRASAEMREPRYRGGVVAVIDYLLPAHISGLACSMLLYTGNRLAPLVFAVLVSLITKALLRVNTPVGSRHFLNPSNTGIAVTLVLFPWVGVVQPYHFTEELSGMADWALPGVILCTGSLLNGFVTQRLPLILAWLLGFAFQALVRSLVTDVSLLAALSPMTGVAFLLFTFYMAPDPGTTPESRAGQIAFGLSVAGVYGLIQEAHVVFGLFFALLLVCCVRGGMMQVAALRQASSPPVPAIR